jgi:hypothetical protein
MNVTKENRCSNAMKNTYQVQSKSVFFLKVSLKFCQLWMCNSCKIKQILDFFSMSSFMMPVKSSVFDDGRVFIILGCDALKTSTPPAMESVLGTI